MNKELKNNKPIFLGLISVISVIIFIAISFYNKSRQNDLITLLSGVFMIFACVTSFFGFIITIKNFTKKKILKGILSLLLNMFIPLYMLAMMIVNGLDLYRAIFSK